MVRLIQQAEKAPRLISGAFAISGVWRICQSSLSSFFWIARASPLVIPSLFTSPNVILVAKAVVLPIQDKNNVERKEIKNDFNFIITPL